MKTAIISYSLTGNNDALATRVAKELKAEHIKITEPHKRTNGKIAADLIFAKIPSTRPGPQVITSYDFIIFVAPVWMGQPAFPLRSYLKFLKNNPRKYAFISISGGAMNDNPGLASALKKRTGTEPAAIMDMNIANLLPPEPKPTAKETSAYQLTGEDVEKLATQTLGFLKAKLPAEIFLS